MTEPLACVAPGYESGWMPEEESSSNPVSYYTPPPYTGEIPEYLLPDPPPPLSLASDPLSCSMVDGDDVLSTSSRPSTAPASSPALPAPRRPAPAPARDAPDADPDRRGAGPEHAAGASTGASHAGGSSPGQRLEQAATGQSVDLAQLDAANFDDQAAQQRVGARMMLARPVPRVRGGAIRLTRDPLYLSVTPAEFSAPRALAVKSRSATEEGTQKAVNPQATDPDLPRAAYAEAAGEAASLYARLVAAANDIARDAHAQNEVLAEQHRVGLERALDRLGEGLDQGLLQLATRRDFALDTIRAQSDLLRSRIHGAAGGALGRLAAMHRFYIQNFEPVKGQRASIVARITTGFNTVSLDASVANAALADMSIDPHSYIDFEQPPAMRAAQFEAVDEHVQQFIDDDDTNIANRMIGIENFLRPLKDCLPCEIDRNLQQLDIQENNVATLGPAAVRAARDGALRSVSETQQQLELSVAEAHRQTEEGLVAQHDSTRAGLISQAGLIGSMEQADIKGNARRNIDGLTGMAGAQSVATKTVHGELVKASDKPLTQFGPAATYAARRLRANLQSTAEKQPATVLGIHDRQRSARLPRIALADNTRRATVDEFGRDLIALVNSGYDRLELSTLSTFGSMDDLPSKVGRVADGFVGPAMAAVQADIGRLSAFMTHAHQRVNDALTGAVTPPIAAPGGGGGGDPAAEPNMCSIDDNQSTMSSTAPAEPVASTPPPGGPAPRGGGPPSPASCAACAPTPPAATAPGPVSTESSSESPAANPLLSPGGEPNMSVMPPAASDAGPATTSTTPAAGETGVSSSLGETRSAAAFHRYARRVALSPESATATAGFVSRISTNLPKALANDRPEKAHKALSESGQPNMLMLFDALHSLTALQAAALQEGYHLMFPNEPTLEAKINERIKQSGVSYVTTREFNMNAALAMLGGDTREGAINELRASFNFSNEDARIREVMARLTASQMQDLVAHHGDEMRELATQLDDADREIFLAMMDTNSTRARSRRFKSDLDGITTDLLQSRNRTTAELVTERGDRTATAFRDTEYARPFAMEGDPALEREDVFGLLADSEADARRRTERWQAIQADFGTLPGVIEAIAYASPDRAVSRPTDTTSTILLDYATRPVSMGGFYYTPEDAARRRERRESGEASGNGAYFEAAFAAMDSGVTPQHRLQLQQMAVHGSDSDEARGAGLLVERMRSGGPNRDKLDQVLHIGSADARLGGHYADRSKGEAEANSRRANVFALSEQFRLSLNGDSFVGPIDASAAQATVRAEFAATLEGDPNRRDIVLGMVDSEHGDMRAVINDAIAREDTAFALTYLRRMDRRQVDAFVDDWNARRNGGPTLQERLGLFQHHWSVYNRNGAVFTGDTANELELGFYGVEQNDKERGEVALRTMNQQIEQSGALGRTLAGSEYDALLANAQRLREQMGVEPAELDEQGRIRMDDPEHDVHVRVNFDRDGNFVPATGSDVGLFERTVTLGRITAEDYTRAVDRIGSTISTILVIAAAVISTIATGGAALSIWIPMAVTAAAGLAGVAINIALKGGRYGRDDLVRDLVSTAVQTLTAGLGAAAGIASRAGAGGKLMALRAVTSRMRLPEATLARFMATRGGLRAALTMTQELRNAAVIGAFSNAATTALDPAARRSGDYGSQVFHSFWRGGLGGAVNAGAARVLAKGVGNALSNSASRSAIARAMASGRSEAVAQRFGRLASSRMGNSLFSNVASRSLAGGFGGALSRGVEMGYEANIQGKHYAGSDYFDQISHAFLQNAAQGTLEAVGDRAMRRLSPGRKAEHHADQAMRASMRDPEGFLYDDRMLAHAERMAAAQSDDLATQSPAAILREGEDAPPTPRPAADEDAGPLAGPRHAEEGEGPRRPAPANDDEALAEIGAVMIRADDAESARPGRVAVGANDNGPAGSRPVYLKSNLADGEVLSRGRVPEGSVFIHEQSTRLDAANDNFVRLINADPSREVAVYHNPDTGEYLVIQGGKDEVAIITHTGEIKSGGAGFPAEALARRGGRWLLRHHFHPNREGWTATNMSRVLASGRKADMHVMEYEARAHGMASRSSRIYFVHEGELRYTDFGVVLTPSADGGPGRARFWIDFPDPATGRRIPREFDGINAYQQFFREQTAGDAPYVAPDGPIRARTDDAGPARPSLDPARRVGSEAGQLGDTLTPANRADAGFVGQRMGLAEEFRASRMAGVEHASGLDPALGRAASISDAHDMVTRMGLVDRPESMRRLAALLNDAAIDPATKGQVLEAVREATRQAMVRDGRLGADEPLFLTLHGAPDKRAGSIRGEGFDLAKVTGGATDDFSRALYTSTGIHNAIAYMTKGRDAGRGEIFPALLRQRDLGTVVDVTPTGQHRAAWEAFVRVNMHLLGPNPDRMMMPETAHQILEQALATLGEAAAAGAPIAFGEAHQRAMESFDRTAPFDQLGRGGTRGILFDAFLAHLGQSNGDPRLANPDIVIGELGGTLTGGLGSGDQQAIRSQRIADLINEQLGIGTPRIAADDPETGRPRPPAGFIEVPGVPWPVRQDQGMAHVDVETHRLLELGFERAFGPVHREGRRVDDVGEVEIAAARSIANQRAADMTARIGALAAENTAHGKLLGELLAAAPVTTHALLMALLPGIARQSMPLLPARRVAAFMAELEQRGIKGAAAGQLLANLRTTMSQDSPVVQNLSDLAERLASPISAAALNTLGDEAFARLIDATEIKRIGGLVTLPAGPEIGRLMAEDAGATVGAVRAPGTIEARVEAYAAARRANGASEQDIANAIPSIRAALADPQLAVLLDAARAKFTAAGITSEGALADMVATSPVLRQLAAVAPEFVAARYAREMQRLAAGKAKQLTAARMTEQMIDQYSVHIIRPIISEIASAFHLGSDVGVDVLKANALGKGVANEGDIDIVAVLRRRPGESPDALARVLLVDDKAETKEKLSGVPAMEGEGLIRNLRRAMIEIDQNRKVWADLGYPPDPLHVQASNQMFRALVELTRLHADASIGATRPKGRDVPRHRRADYVAEVAAILKRNGITMLITSEYGAVRQLAPWMQDAGIELIDDYILRLKREGVIRSR